MSDGQATHVSTLSGLFINSSELFNGGAIEMLRAGDWHSIAVADFMIFNVESDDSSDYRE